MACCAVDAGPFCVGEVSGFPVGALGDEAHGPGFGHAYGVLGNCRLIELFGFGGEEGEERDVDAWFEGSAGVFF